MGSQACRPTARAHPAHRVPAPGAWGSWSSRSSVRPLRCSCCSFSSVGSWDFRASSRPIPRGPRWPRTASSPGPPNRSGSVSSAESPPSTKPHLRRGSTRQSCGSCGGFFERHRRRPPSVETGRTRRRAEQSLCAAYLLAPICRSAVTRSPTICRSTAPEPAFDEIESTLPTCEGWGRTRLRLRSVS